MQTRRLIAGTVTAAAIAIAVTTAPSVSAVGQTAPELTGMWVTDEGNRYEFVPAGDDAWNLFLRSSEDPSCETFIDDVSDGTIAFTGVFGWDSPDRPLLSLQQGMAEYSPCRLLGWDIDGSSVYPCCTWLEYNAGEDEIWIVEIEDCARPCRTIRRSPCSAASDGRSFADQVVGRSSHSIDSEFARLAADVYPGASSPAEGWERLTDEELEDLGIDPRRLDSLTGLSVAVYDGADGCVLAFAGTDEPIDWVMNLLQGSGIPAAQYGQAVALARDVKASVGDSLAITGHSLGGGLASVAALATDTPAVTFNAAGPRPVTIALAGVDPTTFDVVAENGLIRRYTVEHEALTFYQEDYWLTDLAMPDAVGYRLCLPSPRPFPDDVLDELAYRVDMHLMDAVLAAMPDVRVCD